MVGGSENWDLARSCLRSGADLLAIGLGWIGLGWMWRLWCVVAFGFEIWDFVMVSAGGKKPLKKGGETKKKKNNNGRRKVRQNTG